MPTGAEAVRFEGYRCSTCGAEYGPEAQRYLCPRDGGCLEVVLDLRRARGAQEAAGVPVEPAAEVREARVLSASPVRSMSRT